MSALAPRAVIFDCDGVIVDSEGLTFDLILADLAAAGLQMTRAAAEAEFIGGTIELVGQRAREMGANLSSDWVPDFYQRLYRELGEKAELIPGILDVFDALDRNGVPFAVGSNGSMEKMQVTLGGRGLLTRFRAVLSGQAMGRPKPAPDLYLAAAKACGAEPGECLVIEDTPTGARAAIAAGIPCLGYAPLGPRTALAEGFAALDVPMFADMRDLPQIIGLLG